MMTSKEGSSKSEVIFDYQTDWGQRFEKLAQMYRPGSDTEEDSEYEFADVSGQASMTNSLSLTSDPTTISPTDHQHSSSSSSSSPSTTRQVDSPNSLIDQNTEGVIQQGEDGVVSDSGNTQASSSQGKNITTTTTTPSKPNTTHQHKSPSHKHTAPGDMVTGNDVTPITSLTTKNNQQPPPPQQKQPQQQQKPQSQQKTPQSQQKPQQPQPQPQSQQQQPQPQPQQHKKLEAHSSPVLSNRQNKKSAAPPPVSPRLSKRHTTDLPTTTTTPTPTPLLPPLTTPVTTNNTKNNTTTNGSTLGSRYTNGSDVTTINKLYTNPAYRSMTLGRGSKTLNKSDVTANGTGGATTDLPEGKHTTIQGHPTLKRNEFRELVKSKANSKGCKAGKTKIKYRICFRVPCDDVSRYFPPQLYSEEGVALSGIYRESAAVNYLKH
ncbi:hypothetical protein Pmani_039454 [Petrolisthes manimaculis]|uniref:Uncharacterized protein n=1 Tax=Petrolisthes manimaculis TaxID=1843537 RepID=A0AAE1NE64_9EUCA|nr:hypothetical protein Pmani_039454 [Petrolisthes manimaculis]